MELLPLNSHYLLAVEQTVHQILIYSLKNQKLKKKLTGHRTQISGLAYCRQRSLFASISHDQCIIYNQNTLNKQKTLKCQTSSFTDCIFSLSGSLLVTAFKDSTIFFWNLQDYNHYDISLAHKNLKLAINTNSIIVAYNFKNLLLADLTKSVLNFQQIIKFWEGNIQQVNFVDNTLLINTDQCFYLVEIKLQHQFKIGQVKQIRNSVNNFTVAEYQSVILLLANKYKRFSLMTVQRSKKLLSKDERSPLTNEGLVCAGGYSNSEGCFLINNVNTNNIFSQDTHQVEKINNLVYCDNNTLFSLEKLQNFVRKHHGLPDKHRPLAYKFLLKLPINSNNFRTLQSKGRHECIQLLDTKYPLQNKKVAQTMKDILSHLAHYHPIFAEYDNIPAIIFPFICLFGNDHFLCFQILYRLFTRTLAFLFDQFPLANSKYLQNMYEILSKQDPQLLNYLNSNQISFTKICWGLLSNFFTINFSRQNFLSLVDSILVHPNNPQYIMFVCLGYLVYNRTRIFTIKNEYDMMSYFDQEHTVHIGKLLGTIDRIYENQKKSVYYHFNVIDFETNVYELLQNVPKDSLKMYENKRKVLTQELFKKQQEEIYRDKMLNEMEKMIVKAKRDAERQLIEKQAYQLHCQNQTNNKFILPTKDHRERIVKIQKLMEQLIQALNNQKNKKQILKGYMPAFNNLQVQSNEQLDTLQHKLMQLLTEIKPNSFNHPLKNQPFAVHKPTVADHKVFKSAVNSQLTNKLWELDSLSHANQGKKWQNNILSSMKV